MSAVLPTLTQWIENHITSIYQATSQDTSNALNNFLSKDATITVNGKVISRDDTAKQLQLEKFLEIGASVKFTDTVEVPTDKSNTVEAGSVGIFYTVIIAEAIRIRDAPETHKVTASLNVVIEQDLSIPAPPPTPLHVFSDRRRVKSLNVVLIDVPVPITI